MYLKILILLFSWPVFCASGSSYLEKFENYRYWSSHLPPQYQKGFVQFIQQPGPLATKLREKWLIFLGEKHQWSLITRYYRNTGSTVLQCHAAFAFLQEHQPIKASQIATPLWLVGHSQPNACQPIFQALNTNPSWRARYRNQRIKLALDEKNLLLARQLLNHGSIRDKKASEQFAKIHVQPEYFTKLPMNPWHHEQTLYALKRMALLNRSDRQIQKYYHFALQKKWLQDDQVQRFAELMALYTAMRNQAQTIQWFSQVRPQYYNETLLEWQMRYALLHQRWGRVKAMILKMHKPLQSEKIYWLARAELHLQQKELALVRIKKLAKERSYYGFLASHQLHQPFSFQENKACYHYQNLQPYHSLLGEIRQAYQQKYLSKAAQLLNDFVLELPQAEQCSLVAWVAYELHWTYQAILMSQHPALVNQLPIRFPTQYASVVQQQALSKKINPAFIYAIIRQESAFNSDIISPVGARGLMQLMPKTARLISKRYHIGYRNDQALYDGPKNIEIGTQYLNELHRSLKHPLLVAAAYNAGPRAALNWVKTYPAPDIITWIDTLPWKETRNYLKNIVSFCIIYQHRLNAKVNIREVLQPLPGQHQRNI